MFCFFLTGEIRFFFLPSFLPACISTLTASSIKADIASWLQISPTLHLHNCFREHSLLQAFLKKKDRGKETDHALG